MLSQAIPFPQRTSGFVSVNQLLGLFKEHFEFLGLITILVGVLLYNDYDKNMMQTVIDNPRKSDFFYVDYRALDPSSDARFRYVPMKVLEANTSGVVLKVGNIAHSTPVSPRQHAKLDRAVLMRNYYRENTVTLSYQEINELLESGAIYNARRPSSVYISGWIVIPEREIFVED